MSAFDKLRTALYGDPTSSIHKPSREGVLDAFAELTNDFTDLKSDFDLLKTASIYGVQIYPDLNSLEADLNPEENAVVWIYEDTTDSNNGQYRKIGASGSGSWVRVGDVPEALYQAVIDDTKNRQYIVEDFNNRNISALWYDPLPLIRNSISRTTDNAIIDVTSRDSDTQFTVTSGNGSKIELNSTMVVNDDVNDTYTVCNVLSVSGDIVTTYPNDVLPSSISQVQNIHQEGTNGQHLSLLGYRAYIEDMYNSLRINMARTLEPLVYYDPYLCKSVSFNDPDIYTRSGNAILHEVERLGFPSGAGGFVPGTNNSLSRQCVNASSDSNINTPVNSRYAGRYYGIRETTQGYGIRMVLDIEPISGVLVIPISAARQSYTGGFTEGRARLKVLLDNVEIHNEVYSVGHVKNVSIPHEKGNQLTVEFTLADDLPSWILLHGVIDVPRSTDISTTRPLFNNGDVIVIYQDSWGEFTQLESGETAPLRADGSTANGSQTTTKRVREMLDRDGINATVVNMSRSGQTSVWGNYWKDNVLNTVPNATHIVVGFGINDLNSADEFTNDSPSIYDFDPDNMWLQLNKDIGGVKGSIDADGFRDNMIEMVSFFESQNVQPIVMLPPYTASVGQSQNLANHYHGRLKSGYSNKYDKLIDL